MGILKKMTDEYFGDSVRDEDYVKYNFDEIKPVDMGGSVLWADRDLEVVDGGGWYEHHDYFSGDDVMGMKLKDGWRLPKYDDFFELYDNGVKRTIVGLSLKADDDRRSVIFYISDSDSSDDDAVKTSLVFKKKGYYHWKNHKELINEYDFFERWTSKIGEDYGQVGTEIYGFNVYYDKKLIKRNTDWCLHSSKAVFLPLRLVKDK